LAALGDCVCARAPATEARAPVDCKKKSRLVVSDKCSHLVICYSRYYRRFHNVRTPVCATLLTRNVYRIVVSPLEIWSVKNMYHWGHNLVNKNNGNSIKCCWLIPFRARLKHAPARAQDTSARIWPLEPRKYGISRGAFDNNH